MQAKITLERLGVTKSRHLTIRPEVIVQKLCHQKSQLPKIRSSHLNRDRERESFRASAQTQNHLPWTWTPLALASSLVRVNVNPKWVPTNSSFSITAKEWQRYPRIRISKSLISEDTATLHRKRQPPNLMTSTSQVVKNQWLDTVISCHTVSRVR